MLLEGISLDQNKMEVDNIANDLKTDFKVFNNDTIE